MKAHQRIMREKLAMTEVAPTGIDLSIGSSEVREITPAEASKIILKYEYLKRMSVSPWHCFGIFFGGEIAGAVVFSNEYAENLGVWDKYGYTGKIILLSRGACVHWAHPHAGSKLISTSIRMLPPKFEVVTATVDPDAGEIGTLYQACNFFYVGSMRKKRGKKNRAAYLVDGKRVSARTLRDKYGTQVAAEKAGAVRFNQPSKGRYFFFRGRKTTRTAHRKAIDHLMEPYPRRQT